MTFEQGRLKIAPHRGVKNPVLTRQAMRDKDVEFVADPFLMHKNGLYYLFFEALKRAESKKGIIGLAVSKDCRKWKFQKVVLEEPFHLSYPFLFNLGEKCYMLPETYQAKSVRLYEAIHFPDEWQFTRTLIEGREFVDPTLFFRDGKFWLFVSDTSNGNLYLFYADAMEKAWQEHPRSPIVRDNPSIARPGGNVVLFGDRVIRIAQDDLKHYGCAVRAFAVTKLDIHEYEEKELPESPILNASGKGWNKDGMHHLSTCQINDKEWIISVDGMSVNKRRRFCGFSRG